MGDREGYPLQNFLKFVAANSDDLEEWLDEEDGREGLVKGYLEKYERRAEVSQYEDILRRGNLWAITDALLKEGNPIDPCWVLVKG